MRVITQILLLSPLTACTFTVVGNAPKTEDAVAQEQTVNATYAKSEQFIPACENDAEDIAAFYFWF
jgi:hypothetical protein